MNLADKPCYPTSFDEDDGLTFKERLIIALASNPVMFYDDQGNIVSGDNRFEVCTLEIIGQADELIKQLEKQ